MIGEDLFEDYSWEVRAAGLWVGMEIDGHRWVPAAQSVQADYRIFHCYDRDADYKALERLLETGQPVIVAHPNALSTDLRRVPPECLVEINNRYVWRCDWWSFYGPFVDRFEPRDRLGCPSAQLAEPNGGAPCRQRAWRAREAVVRLWPI